MALETPTWLNLCFMEKALRKSENDNSIQVIDIFTKPATNKGDNYTSDMIRVNVEYSRDQNGHKTTKKKSVIVKITPIVEGVRQDLIMKSRIFITEILMMTDTLNKMNNLLDPKYRLSGKGLYVQHDNPTLLVIEDLAPLGYRMACRQTGLDLNHCILAIRGLARFHATSVALCEKEPKQKQMYSRGMFNSEYPPEMGGFFILGTSQLAKEMENWPGMKKYAEKIAKLADKIYQIGIEACKISEDEFNVINHGDCWVNNMLFNYNDDGKPINHIFVDFQLCVYTSPAIDLLYFFSTSPSLDVIENKRDILFNEYMGTLSATMKQLNCKTQPPTLEELKATLRQRAAYGMISSFTVLPLVMADKSEIKDLDEILDKDGYTNPAYKNEIYQKIMMKRIPMYDEWGLLDL
ncbi:uncharacterized protein LOC126855304 [Cataglyphis hispanica]|uniref:uncharacterized protein LOC126855304 n=1 Tax=Cataglyphis hispanica TaxID=1086592 RepID=UPI00218040EA|nr:uncharacterized protein LOC126855304 [Cataglyphis hispanica]XP_050458789.1 uncharacterized protein LOC126855304 [Cataglyphis hispanica]XP_050458790.1 uncharacterized protein LOC126855304 [Cataglyphis hispanica]XP_050458791.1 uncharacterized protein LOC126855304 [Cataglyphis hispanica]